MIHHRFHLDITERCNLRCPHCYREGYGEHPDPSLAEISEILKILKGFCRSFGERGRHGLTLGGGEPLLRPDLAEIAALAGRCGFRVRLDTNGTLLDAARARQLRRAGVRMAQVSVDGADAATLDRIRGTGSWADITGGVRALRQAGIFTILSCVLLPGLNTDGAPFLLDLARDLDAAGVKFARPVRHGQAVLHGISVRGEYWDTFLRILRHAQEIRFRRLLFFFDPLAHRIPVEHPELTRGVWGLSTDLCQCHLTRLLEVNACTGDVYYCRLREKLGNIRRDDLCSLWRTHPLLDHLRRKSPGGCCRDCPAWAGCRGGCPAVVRSDTGEAMMPDDACPRVQGSALPREVFAAGRYERRPQPALADQIRLLRRQLKDLAYWFTLR